MSDRSRYLTDAFDPAPFACHSGEPTPDWAYPNLHAVWDMLDVLRRQWPGCDVEVMSGYRTPAYNAKVGGEPHSFHMAAKAADVKVYQGGQQIPPDIVADTAANMQTLGTVPLGGIGRYPSFTHLDVRGYKARWRR